MKRNKQLLLCEAPKRLIDEKRFLKNLFGRRGSKRFSRLLVDISAPLRRQPHSLCDNFDPRLVNGEISTHNRTDERPTDGRTMDSSKHFRTSEIVTSDTGLGVAAVVNRAIRAHWQEQRC